ncbi:hypothetical protein TNCV_2901351 [Trichonephila clavipes]|nr:hypothetical protein TNCV_2901351 [Trichonephila clavipes]
MDDDSFRLESPVNTSKPPFFFPEFDTNKFSSFKSFLDCFDQQCLEYQKTNKGRSKILLDVSREYILNFVTPDNPNQNAVETGSYTRWNIQADGSVHRGTDPRHRFQSRGYHGQQHQSHMVRFNGRQQLNSQPR